MKNNPSSYRFRRWIRAAFIAITALVAGVPVAVQAQGAIIWDGPTISYTQPGTDPTQAANQDRLTPNVWLTRGSTQGLFNAALESSYTHDFSPEDTEWAFGALTNYASLTYQNWEAWTGVNPPSTVGRPAVVHLISENIYLSIEFTSWGARTGGFSYIRSTPSPVPEPASMTLLAVGLATMLVRRKNRSF